MTKSPCHSAVSHVPTEDFCFAAETFEREKLELWALCDAAELEADVHSAIVAGSCFKAD